MTIYSDDDRYRGVKNLRTLIFMNAEDACAIAAGKIRPHRREEFRKGRTTREVRGYRAIPRPRGSAMGYMPSSTCSVRSATTACRAISLS